MYLHKWTTSNSILPLYSYTLHFCSSLPCMSDLPYYKLLYTIKNYFPLPYLTQPCPTLCNTIPYTTIYTTQPGSTYSIPVFSDKLLLSLLQLNMPTKPLETVPKLS